MSFSDLWTVHTQMFFEVKTMQIFIKVGIFFHQVYHHIMCYEIYLAYLLKKDFFVTKKDSLVRESGKKFQ